MELVFDPQDFFSTGFACPISHTLAEQIARRESDERLGRFEMNVELVQALECEVFLGHTLGLGEFRQNQNQHAHCNCKETTCR